MCPDPKMLVAWVLVRLQHARYNGLACERASLPITSLKVKLTDPGM